MVPELTPVTIPVDEPTVAIPVLLLLHMPPVAASDKVVVVPIQALVFPEIGSVGLTVTIAIALQPLDIV